VVKCDASPADKIVIGDANVSVTEQTAPDIGEIEPVVKCDLDSATDVVTCDSGTATNLVNCDDADTAIEVVKCEADTAIDVVKCEADTAKDVAHCDLDTATDGLKLARDISSDVEKCDSHAAIHHVVESSANRLVIVIRKGDEFMFIWSGLIIFKNTYSGTLEIFQIED
jgi:hypothetical protein